MGHLKSVLLITMFIVFLFPGILLAGDTPSYEMGFYGYPLNYIRILKHETFFPEGHSLYVTELEEESRFAQAGMRKEDIITSFNGRRINSYKQAQNIVNSSRGSTVSVVISRLSPRFRYKKSKDPFYKPRSLTPYREHTFKVEIPKYTPPSPVPVLAGPGGELYHSFGKRHSPDTKEARVFKSRQEAAEAGLKPCRICFPGSKDEDLDEKLIEELVGVSFGGGKVSPVFKKLKANYEIISELPEDMKRIADRIFPYRVRTYLQPEIIYVDTNKVYSFSLEEGKLVITRGLWELLETETEKAFHLAHVLAHLDMRHQLSIAGKGKVFELIENAAKNAAGSRAWGYLKQVHEELADYFLGLRVSEHGYSGEEEREALCVAFINLYRAGYDFDGLEIYRKKREDMVDNLTPKWANFLLHHPLPGSLPEKISIWEDRVPKYFNKGVIIPAGSE